VNRTLAAIFVGLAAALAAIGLATGSDDEEKPERPEVPERIQSRVGEIAERVEEVRGLEFKRPPRLEFLTPAAVRRLSAKELARVPSEDIDGAEETLKLLGLIRPEDDLRELVNTLIADETAGFYVPRTDRLVLVRGAVGGGILAEIALAHELVHALEDQHFDLETDELSGLGDRSTARSALNEGTATVAMVEYAVKHLGLEGRREMLLDEIARVSGLDVGSDLPPYLKRVAVFPYTAGTPYVDRIVERGGWVAVDRLIESGAPQSTEQVIHERDEPPLRPPALASRPHEGAWRRVDGGQLGELDTEELLRVGVRGALAERAAEGWGSGRYELWRNGPLRDPGCAAPCRRRDLFTAGWRMDSPREAEELDSALRGYLAAGLDARRSGQGWLLEGGAAAVERNGDRVALAFAPTPALALRQATATVAR
jgi:hypothetical protein